MAKVTSPPCSLRVPLHFEVTIRIWEALLKISKFLRLCLVFSLTVHFGIAEFI